MDLDQPMKDKYCKNCDDGNTKGENCSTEDKCKCNYNEFICEEPLSYINIGDVVYISSTKEKGEVVKKNYKSVGVRIFGGGGKVICFEARFIKKVDEDGK